MDKTKKFDFTRAAVGLPFFLIFIVNLYITRLHGFVYAGELAVFAGVSTFISILLSMRWDVEILVKENNKLSESLSNGITTIFIFSFILLFVYFIFYSLNRNDSFDIFLLYSAILIAFYELHINIFLKKNEIINFVVLRLVPPLLLVLFSIEGFTPGQAWFFSYLFSLLILLCSVFYFHNGIWNISSSYISIFQKIKLMLPPTFSALIANSISVVWLISLTHIFGSYEAGLWINAYRITSLPIVFCGAVILPLVLVSIGDKSTNYAKYLTMFKYSFLLLLLTLISSIIFYLEGVSIFDTLTNQENSISVIFLLLVLFISFMQYFIQHWKDLFQSVNKTIAMLLILVIELFLAILIYFYFDGVVLESFINWIFAITSFCFSLILILITTSFIFFKNLNSTN